MDPRTSRSSLDDEDESVRIAVKALGDMRNSSLRSDTTRTPHSLTPQPEPGPASPAFVSRMSSIPLLKSALNVYEQGKASSRVVKYGAEMVESSVKTLSKPVIERLPVNVNQLDEFACRQLDRLDRYRRPSVGESTSSRPSPILDQPEGDRYRALEESALALDESESQSSRSRHTGRESRAASDVRARRGWKDGGERGIPSWIESTNSFASSSIRSDERSSTPTQSRERSATTATTTDGGGAPEDAPSNEQQVAQRSRWQAVLLEAGGLSAALSEDSMRRLKYCLHWLQYATAHIDAQILILREFTASLQEYPPSAPPHARRPNPISQDHMRKLSEVRKDIVKTVREVVDVVSKYAGGALPEPARARVRGFVLKLPQRWASTAKAAGAASVNGNTEERDSVTAAAGGAAGRRAGARRVVNRERGAGAALDVVVPPGSGRRSGASSAATSPAASPRLARGVLAPMTPVYVQSTHARLAAEGAGAGEEGQGGGSAGAAGGGGGVVSQGAAIVAAQRILSLATESLDMMRGVTGVVKDSLDRADMWVTRLRTVGLQRAAREGEGEGEGGQTPREERSAATDGYGVQVPVPSEDHMHHRRGSSSQFSDDMYDDHDAVPPSPPFWNSASGSSSAWNESVPGTPAGSGAWTPPVGSGIPSEVGGVVGGKSPVLGIASIPIGRMTLASRGNTPRRGVVGLPGEEGEEGMVQVVEGGAVDSGDVGVVEMEVDEV
ncbi:transcription factor Opi1-domain-containing protein [Ephemerocybe angulata]|uniref:Transcription factor Opi1-domain-containing protein n=1 Tax=Ephemerocybe angulata TaxID=980116 RepID=A0A8H6LWA5_9AGAR|nr:transcription factor Opi1-domain-containing protein [Tulosesus angulatus]